MSSIQSRSTTATSAAAISASAAAISAPASTSSTSSTSSKAITLTSTQCSICLQISQARGGGIPLLSPGCCGSWFHQECIDKLKAQNINNCPNCRAIFTNNTKNTIINKNKKDQPKFFFRSNRLSQSLHGMNIFNCGQTSSSQLSYDREDALPTQSNINIGVNNDNNEENMTTKVMATVTTAPEYPIISMNETASFYARVTLKYEESMTSSQQQRTPMDIVCVLDKSGSMEGSKISSLKNAMNFVIDSLTEKDRLSIISFESDSKLIHGLLLMTPENKVQSKSLFASLSAGGGTEILTGMKHGNSILEKRQQRNAASCMFLLTDGQDRQYTAEKLDLAKKMKADGTSLFVFGFGADHDSEHMAAIANAAEGTFTYIESDDVVTDAFGGTIGTIQGVSLSNINLNVQTSERNVVIEQIIAGRYITSKSVDGRSGTISFVNMYIGESRDILLLLSLPAVDEPIQDYELFKAHATYYIQGDITKRESNSIECNVDRNQMNLSDLNNNIIQRDITVDVHINRHACTTALSSALLLADNNNFEEAKIKIQNALTLLKTSVSYQAKNIIVITLEADLMEALQIVSSKQQYSMRGGRASIEEVSRNHTIQRECYQKSYRTASAYQTSSSTIMQERANRSKY